MMRCKGNKRQGFHDMAMMKHFRVDDRGHHFACPICGRVAIVPWHKKPVE